MPSTRMKRFVWTTVLAVPIACVLFLRVGGDRIRATSATEAVGVSAGSATPKRAEELPAPREGDAQEAATAPLTGYESRALESAPDGVLAGSVVDGLGVARDVRLVLAPIGGARAERVAAQRRLSDLALDHGRFRFEEIPPGRWELTVCDELYCAPPLVIETDGKGIAGIVLEASVGQRVRVETGASGVVTVRDGSGRTWHEREHDGTALLALLPGAYRIDVRTNEGEEHGLDFVVADRPVRIDLRP